MAQSAAGALLGLARRFPALMDAQRRHRWEPLLGDRAPRDLQGQTAVIVGLGPIGRALAATLKVLGLTVIGIRREASPVPPCDETVTAIHRRPCGTCPTCIVSPHTASHSQSLNENVFGIFLDNLARWRRGGKLRNDVDDMS